MMWFQIEKVIGALGHGICIHINVNYCREERKKVCDYIGTISSGQTLAIPHFGAYLGKGLI